MDMSHRPINLLIGQILSTKKLTTDRYTKKNWALRVELKGQIEAEPDLVTQQVKATSKLNVMEKPTLSSK